MTEKTQEELLAEQKKNCIFCQIIEGKVPSKKVYEDDLMIAILDIHPAHKGHILVMSKEHYPIMPLIPPETFKHLFSTTTQLTNIVKKGILAEESLVFIANGGVAGQQSPHFLFHIIPRDKGELSKLDLPNNDKDQSELFPSMKHNLILMMKNHLSREGKLNLLDLDEAKTSNIKTNNINTDNANNNFNKDNNNNINNINNDINDDSSGSKKIDEPKKTTVFDSEKIDQLAAMIENNPELKALLINNPDKLKIIVENNPDFKKLFAGIDISALGEQVKKQYFSQNSNGQESENVLESKKIVDEGETTFKEDENKNEDKRLSKDPVPRAVDMSVKELRAYIDSKEKLKHYLFSNVDLLKELIPEHERLKKFFEETNPEEVLKKYNEHNKDNEPDEEKIKKLDENASLDDIATYFGGK